MTHKLHITLAQINPIVGDIAFNLDLIRKVRDDAPAYTDLIVFPEMAVCGYPPEDLVLKPVFIERIVEALQILAQESGGKPSMIVPAPWRGTDGAIYNAAHLVGDGDIRQTVLKHHLPNYGVFDEARIFKAGPLPAPIDFKGHKLGVMICEDMWYADVAAHLKAAGAELLISVNASPYEVDKNNIRLDHARARVAETGLPLLYVNQCGGQDELVFDGASFVLNEAGTVIVQAEEFVEDIHHTVWEKADGAAHWLCGTDAITPLHGTPESIYQALVIGLRDYVTKNGFPGVIIGLSGGIDSALSASIAVDALGSENVHCVMMPSKFTSQDSLEDAAACAEHLGVHYDTIAIESAVAAFETELEPHFNAGTPATMYENIQPRCRGLILMALSNASGKMVLSTGNKSEMAVGYATLYGDMCGGFNVLKDVYKIQVYELSRWRNVHKPDHSFGPQGLVIPERIITKAPTAELKENQTDQDTLPAYETLDAILRGLIEEDLDVAAITAQGHDEAIVRRVWSMLDRAEYKRRQAPPGIKITSRAFGRDRRYPITNHFTGS
ncbi:MAG: NAD+ synthase [Rhodospirillales bacterium]|nr:NAD+ synthase [Rhodospirillales bacterium]